VGLRLSIAKSGLRVTFIASMCLLIAIFRDFAKVQLQEKQRMEANTPMPEYIKVEILAAIDHFIKSTELYWEQAIISHGTRN
jgi:hypothetical protein